MALNVQCGQACLGYLLLDVCGLHVPQCQGILCGLAGDRLELGTAEGKAHR